MQIAELVPEIAACERGLIGQAEMARAGQGLEHFQMTGLRLVQARQQAIDDAVSWFSEVGVVVNRMEGDVLES